MADALATPTSPARLRRLRLPAPRLGPLQRRLLHRHGTPGDEVAGRTAARWHLAVC
jgi:hypothetical protein